jgi:hypothetical protein
MLFKTLEGNVENIFINDYKIDWNKKSASQFQFKVKQFFKQNFSLYPYEWFEEVKCAGSLSQLRIDFMCRFKNKWGETNAVFIESDGLFHIKRNNHFNPTDESYIASMERDTCKYLYCERNKIPLLRIYEDDPLTLDWFNSTFNTPFGTAYAK